MTTATRKRKRARAKMKGWRIGRPGKRPPNMRQTWVFDFVEILTPEERIRVKGGEWKMVEVE